MRKRDKKSKRGGWCMHDEKVVRITGKECRKMGGRKKKERSVKIEKGKMKEKGTWSYMKRRIRKDVYACVALYTYIYTYKKINVYT